MAAEINYILLEETLNNLLRDPLIRAVRTRAVQYVTDRLRADVAKRMQDVGLYSPVREEFLTDTPYQQTQLYRIILEKQKELELSGRILQAFRMSAKGERKAALTLLEDYLLDREQIRFRKEAGISAKVWLTFLNSSGYTGEATQIKIGKQLALTPGEQEQFKALFLRALYPVEVPLKREVHRLRKETGKMLSDFLSYAWVSTDAWEAFYPVPTDEKPEEQEEKPKITSQDTLLKLVVGYGLNENEAKRFMEIARSAFALRKDLVVLAGIRCRCGTPMEMSEILEFFAQGPEDKRYYSNPYAV